VLTISLIEDDAVFCELVRERIRSSETLQLAGCYHTAEDALRLLPHEKPDAPAAALVDIKLPRMNGIECVRQFRARVPPLRTLFIILTQYDAENLIFEALQAGADGYLMKDEIAQRNLPALIQEAAVGGAPLSQKIARKMIEFFRHVPGPARSLSSREQQVLQHVADGMPDKAIAHELSISINTVRKHLSQTYQKLHVTSRAAAAVKYTRQSLPHSNH